MKASYTTINFIIFFLLTFYNSQTYAQNDYSLQFDGIDDYVEIPNSFAFDLTTNFTVEAFVKINTQGYLHNSIVSKNPNHGWGSGWELAYGQYSENRFSFFGSPGGTNVTGTYVDPNQETWYHIAGVYDGSSFTIYVNGIEGYPWSVTGDIAINSLPIILGRRSDSGINTHFLKGLINSVRISNTARYSTNFTPPTEFVNDANTVGLWYINEGNGNSINDISGYGNDGIIHGCTWSTDIPTNQHIGFTTSITVLDNCNNNKLLTFGTSPDATECYDAGIDVFSPPPPPSGAFDGRFISCSEGLLKDIKATNVDGIRIWEVHYQPAIGCEPVSFSWDPGQLPPDGNFTLIDFATGGTLVNVNMRTTNNYTDALGLGHLQILFNYTKTISTVIADGWNMISLPLDVEDGYYKTLFSNAIDGTLFGFDGSYYSTDSIKTEEGYWLRFDGPEVVEIEGLEISMMELDLAFGWNMIGGPLCDLALSGILDPGGIIIPGTLFGFDGSYFSEDTIEAGKGYWIRTNASGTVTLDCSNTILAKGNERVAVLADQADFIKVEIEDATGNKQNLYFSGKLGDDVSIESYSLPPIPPSGLFDVRISGGYRLSESDDIEIELQSKNYPLKVKMTGISDGNKDGYLIKEFAGNVEVGEKQITDGLEISISNDKVSLLKIQLGSILPTRFMLEQNFPNPFNPVTQIKYGITVPNNVELIIFNVLGEQVRTLVNETKEKGYYNIGWNGTNDSGVKVGSGIYLYSLRTGNNFSVKKMILLK